MIRKIFDHRMARRLQQMLEDVHEHHDHVTIWLHSDIKKALYVHWKTDEGFKRCRLMNRANRISARSLKYTGGAVIFIKTRANMLSSLSPNIMSLLLDLTCVVDRDATIAETFKYTHTLKENKERFTDQQVADYYVSKHHLTRDDGNNSTASVIDPDMVRHKAASEPYKNRVYRMGLFFVENLRTSTLRHSSASTTSLSVDPKDGINLREQAQQLRESEERYQAILSRMIGTDDLRLEWRR
ncbi:hypothetical protein Ahy_B04g072562 [Arachis hypogaea]|uniref:Uncharacterized protein n=1 Tax=Arachis hypogaea TaxID=3818 RepID=A0A444ZNF7_ARAHY|nr:hypothetical protein Ahy_B04g072562 [Arachis hypogaea]